TGSYNFFQEHKQNVYDTILKWEMESGDRIICQNDKFVSFCPFASKYPYEVRIFMKNGQPHFEQLSDDFDNELAEVLLMALKKIKKALNNPDFNMLIHTAPNEPTHSHDYYCWHIEILPKTKITGGFELGTGVDINVVDPDEAAEKLRNAEV
ncbi:MAG: galactose-1-phosphate uridylyltransferase, partial [Candidatus Paceibacterales bacterium]